MDSSRHSAMNISRQIALGLAGYALTAAAIGCAGQNAQQPAAARPAPPAAGAPAQPVAADQTQAGGGATDAEQPQASLPAPVIVKDVGFKTPESVLFDETQDVYLVSNVNGSPVEADGNGFISKLGPDGKVIELKWIDGAKPEVTLNAPKGMAIADGLLYVTDINFVRVFDAKSGEPKGKIGVPGATFLNGIVAAKDGTLYVSDSGLKAGKDGFEPTGSDSIYRIGKRRMAEKLVADKSLERPNGLAAGDDGVWVASYGTNELYKVGADGKKQSVTKLPKGSLDGLVRLSDGSVLVSSWEASAVYRGKPGGQFSPLVQNVKAPAGIGYDTKRHALLIPLFQSDSVQIQQMAPVTPHAAAPAGAQQAPAAQQQAATTPEAAAGTPAGAAPAKKPAAAPAQKKAAGAPASPQKAAETKTAAAKTPGPKKPQQSAAAEEKPAPATAPAPQK